MKIQTFINGPFSVNTFLLESGNSAVVIDPGHELTELLKHLSLKNLTVSHILITHGHIDHVAGISIIKQLFPNAISMMNLRDNELVKHIKIQTRMLGLPESGQITIDQNLPDSGFIEAGEFNFELFLVPGHSKGSICFKTENNLFTGDTLFAGAVGRSDLFGGSHSELIRNIKDKLFTLADDTIIYPGHGDFSTIIEEKLNNPFF